MPGLGVHNYMQPNSSASGHSFSLFRKILNLLVHKTKDANFLCPLSFLSFNSLLWFGRGRVKWIGWRDRGSSLEPGPETLSSNLVGK